MKNAGPPTKEIILSAARELLRTNSPVDVRPSTIAITTGVSQSLVHYHYPDIRDLLCLAAVGAYVLNVEASRSLLGSDDPTQRILKQWLDLQRAWVQTNRGAAAILLAPTTYGLVRHESWRQAERLMVDGLVPHVLFEHPTFSSKESIDAARLYMFTSLLNVNVQIQMIQGLAKKIASNA